MSDLKVNGSTPQVSQDIQSLGEKVGDFARTVDQGLEVAGGVLLGAAAYTAWTGAGGIGFATVGAGALLLSEGAEWFADHVDPDPDNKKSNGFL